MPEIKTLVVVFPNGTESTDTRIGRRANELDDLFHTEKVNGSVTIHYSQGSRAKVHFNRVE